MAESPISPTQADIAACIQKVATGPEYSKDLTFDEARAGMELILRGEADPVQAAVMLIGLRMKRETGDENRGALRAILDHMVSATSEADEVVDLSDPYNGQLRGISMAPFVAPVLAACGLPAFSQGLESVGPKFGVTHRNILAAAGVRVDDSTAQVAKNLADPAIGWGYIDQSQYCPALHALVPLRNKIIKRTMITTIEVATRPISGRVKTHLMTGYVHRAYPPVYTDIARYAGYDSAAIVRGVEGGLMPSLRQAMRFYRYTADSDDEFVDIDPQSIGIESETRTIPLPGDLKSLEDGDAQDKIEATRYTAELGIAALQNQPGLARDSLVYAAAIALYHVGRHDSLQQAAEAARAAIASGDAWARFNANLI